MSEPRRFSKALALEVLDAKAAAIAKRENFDRGNGTSQLNPNDLSRAVEYGRMRAFEDFACAIEEGFRFEQIGTQP